MTTPLHHFGDAVRSLMLAIPLPVVRLLFLAVPALLLIWVLRLPAKETRPPEGSGRWDENLKVWAGVALVVQMVIYAVF